MPNLGVHDMIPPPLVKNPLSFDSVDPIRHRDPFATLAVCPWSGEAKTLPHSADSHFQAVDAGPLIRRSVLKPRELEGMRASFTGRGRAVSNRCITTLFQPSVPSSPFTRAKEVLRWANCASFVADVASKTGESRESRLPSSPSSSIPP